MRKSAFFLGLAALTAAGAVACSGDDTTLPLNPTSDAGADATAEGGAREAGSDAAEPDSTTGNDSGADSGARRRGRLGRRRGGRRLHAGRDAMLVQRGGDVLGGIWGKSRAMPRLRARMQQRRLRATVELSGRAAPGMTNCGAASESCCTSLEVTGGTFYRTYKTADSTTSGPPDGGWPDEADPAAISGFRLDKYHVTVGRFRQFVNAVLPPDGGTGWLAARGLRQPHAPERRPGARERGARRTRGRVRDRVGRDGRTPTSRPPTPTWRVSPATHVDNTAGTQENLPINCVTGTRRTPSASGTGAFCRARRSGSTRRRAEASSASTRGGRRRRDEMPRDGCEYAIYDCNYPSGSGAAARGDEHRAGGNGDAGCGALGSARSGRRMCSSGTSTGTRQYADPCMDCVQLNSSSFSRVMRGSYWATDVV